MRYVRKVLLIVLSVVGLLGLTTSIALAQDPERGQTLWEEELLCQRCHGEQGEGVWAKPLAGDDLTVEEWISQVRSPRRRMPHFSEEQVTDEMIQDVHAYLTSLPQPSQTGLQEADLPADAPEGQALIAEKRCIACHGLTGPVGIFNRRAELPTAEAVIAQLRNPRNRMPMFSEDQVSDEEAGLIAEFLASEYSPQIQAVPSPLEKALASIGGEEALQNLSTLSIEATGVRWRLDEQFSPGDPAGRVGAFAVQMSYDLEGDNLRLDYTRQGVAGERQVSEIIAGELGYIEGQDAAFGPPGEKEMTSDRWASTLKQQRLLNPHLILRDILADPSIASEGDEQLFNGSVHHLLVIEDEVAPITLYINADSGQIAKLATMENDHLRRDVPLEVFYYNWQQVGSEGLWFPAEVYLALDDEIVLKEIRTAIEVNPALESGLFEFPDGVEPVFDEELAMRGEFSHQFNQLFAAGGFLKDGAQTQIVEEEIAPGIFHLTDVANNSMVIEQENGIVVVEAPLHQYRSEAVIDWVKTTFPDKPISYVVSTHHHTDHSAGLRTYVAEGATVVVHEAAEAFFEEILQADSTILPDALANNPVEATIETVPADGSFTIPDETQPVEVYPIENSHAEDMVIVYVPNEGIVFVSDLYSPTPGADPGAGGSLIHEAITDLDLEVSLIAGGHGTTITFEEFEDLLGLQ